MRRRAHTCSPIVERIQHISHMVFNGEEIVRNRSGVVNYDFILFRYSVCTRQRTTRHAVFQFLRNIVVRFFKCQIWLGVNGCLNSAPTTVMQVLASAPSPSRIWFTEFYRLIITYFIVTLFILYSSYGCARWTVFLIFFFYNVN